jgi:hypothetical protein
LEVPPWTVPNLLGSSTFKLLETTQYHHPLRCHTLQN